MPILFNSRTSDSATAIAVASLAWIPMLTIAKSLLDQIRLHAETAYPEECCGLLLGEKEQVTEAHACQNASATPWRHYEISAKDLIRGMRDALAAGTGIVGFYHSHPDHPAEWSATDLKEAHWLGCSYLITSVDKGVAAATRSFRLQGQSEEDKRFEVEEICISEPSSPQTPSKGPELS